MLALEVYSCFPRKRLVGKEIWDDEMSQWLIRDGKNADESIGYLHHQGNAIRKVARDAFPGGGKSFEN